jgi:hypothetical protein
MLLCIYSGIGRCGRICERDGNLSWLHARQTLDVAQFDMVRCRRFEQDGHEIFISLIVDLEHELGAGVGGLQQLLTQSFVVLVLGTVLPTRATASGALVAGGRGI